MIIYHRLRRQEALIFWYCEAVKISYLAMSHHIYLADLWSLPLGVYLLRVPLEISGT